MRYIGLDSKLEDIRGRAEELARQCNLDFFDTKFFIVSLQELNQLAANSGFYKRYRHWKFGLEFQKLEKFTKHTPMEIYEMVINNDPSYAYILRNNSETIQKIVIGHVYAHVDFFKHNYLFQPTNRQMVNRMADHADIVDRIIKKQGLEKVEDFIEACLSIEDLIDQNAPFKKKREECEDEDDDSGCSSCASCSSCDSCPGGKNNKEDDLNQYKMKTKPYMDRHINTEEFLIKEKEKHMREKAKRKNRPDKDIMKFILEHCDKLNGWQKDILSIIREEAYYFAPQRRTKIMNEGWATFWDSHIMSTMMLAGMEGIIDHADSHSKVVSGNPYQINPYRLGLLLFRDIKERWDKGQHGDAYENEKSLERRMNWNTEEGKGLEKIFQVREQMGDLGFISEFMTDDFIHKHKIYLWRYDSRSKKYKIASRDPREIKEDQLSKITNMGEPVIKAVDGNFQNNKSLLLMHEYVGQELNPQKTVKTLVNLFKVWQRPVYLHTFKDDKPIFYAFNGVDAGVIEQQDGK